MTEQQRKLHKMSEDAIKSDFDESDTSDSEFNAVVADEAIVETNIPRKKVSHAAKPVSPPSHTGTRFSDRSTKRVVNYAAIEQQLDQVLAKVEQDEAESDAAAAEEEEEEEQDIDDYSSNSSDIDITDNGLPNKSISSSAVSSSSRNQASSDEITIEKIMDYRPPKMASADAFLAGALGEFFVKFKGQSYRHCTWITAADIEKEKTGRQKIQRFLAKWKPQGDDIIAAAADDDDESVTVLVEEDEIPSSSTESRHHYGGISPSDTDSQAPENTKSTETKPTETKSTDPSVIVKLSTPSPPPPTIIAHPLSHFQVRKDIFNPDYLLVDRILDEQKILDDNDQTVTYFFCKWIALAYDESTWEKQSDLQSPADLLAIQCFRSRDRPITDSEVQQRKSFKRPTKDQWRKYLISPEYPGNHQLRPYQMEGLNWLRFCWFHRQNSILADEMGLGKTVQSVTLLNSLFLESNLHGPFIVIAPLSTIPHWEREFTHWTGMNVIVYHGSVIARQLIMDYDFYHRNQYGDKIPGVYKFNVLITTYEMVLAASSVLKAIPWKVAVIDEAHRLKNRQSKILEILRTFQMEHRVLLTGTPLQNNLEELWTLLNFLEPTRFPSEKDFMMEFGQLKTDQDVAKLQALLVPLMLRRLKADVETSIPVKEETIIEVELTTFQKKYYRAILEKNFTFLVRGGKKQNMPNLINAMMELRKCCIHPYLIKGAEDVLVHDANADSHLKQFELMIQASGKLVLVDKLLPKLKAGGHKVLIFSQMTRCLDLLEDYLRGRSFNFERIDGTIRGDQRQAAIDRYSRKGADSFVFLLCTKAGGVGINLTAADTVIIFDSDWNPQNDLQAQARCHRIGQEKPVKVYRLITRNSYEREMFDRASLKLGLDKAVLQKMTVQEDSSTGPSLSKREIEELLKKGAYGAVMEDDSAASKFCEEDIDQILERRTIVIMHDQSLEKNSFFSKATFTAAGAAVNVDLHDPLFWEKWAREANLDTTGIILDETQELILDMPRQRKQVQRFRADDLDLLEVDTKDKGVTPNIITTIDQVPLNVLVQKTGARAWSHAERLRLEKYLMIHGMNQWMKIREDARLAKRSSEDIEACCHVILRIAYEGLLEGMSSADNSGKAIKGKKVRVISTKGKKTTSDTEEDEEGSGEEEEEDGVEGVEDREDKEAGDEDSMDSASSSSSSSSSSSNEEDEEEEEERILPKKETNVLLSDHDDDNFHNRKVSRKRDKMTRLAKHDGHLIAFAEQLLNLKERDELRNTRKAEKEAALKSLENELIAQQQSMMNGQDLLDLLNARWTEQDKEKESNSRRKEVSTQNQARLLQMQQMMRAVQSRIESLQKDTLYCADEQPYLECTDKQLAEYRSFYADMKEDQLFNIKRRSRFILQRMQFLSLLRHQIIPHLELTPTDLSMFNSVAKPTNWWSIQDDLDLLKGVALHGYQQYKKILRDETLGFHFKVIGGDEVKTFEGDGEGGKINDEDFMDDIEEYEDEMEEDVEMVTIDQDPLSDFTPIKSEQTDQTDIADQKDSIDKAISLEQSNAISETNQPLPSSPMTPTANTSSMMTSPMTATASSTVVKSQLDKVQWVGNTALNLRLKRITSILMKQLNPKKKKKETQSLKRSMSDLLPTAMMPMAPSSIAAISQFQSDYDANNLLDVDRLDRKLAQRLVEKYLRSEAQLLKLSGKRKRASKKELKKLSSLLNWSKHEKSLFIKTVSNYGVDFDDCFSDSVDGFTDQVDRQSQLDQLPSITKKTFHWENFLKVAGMDWKPDFCLEKFLSFILLRSHQLMTGEVIEEELESTDVDHSMNSSGIIIDDQMVDTVNSNNNNNNPKVKLLKKRGRKPLLENSQRPPIQRKKYEKDVVTRDRAERIMFRLPLIHVIRQQLIPMGVKLPELIEKALQLELNTLPKVANTSNPNESPSPSPSLKFTISIPKPTMNGFWKEYLPKWWIHGEYDVSLIKAIAKYGFGRNDQLIKDDEFPFYSSIYLPAIQKNDDELTMKEMFGNVNVGGGENAGGVVAARLGWPKDRVIYSRIVYILNQLNRLSDIDIDGDSSYNPNLSNLPSEMSNDSSPSSKLSPITAGVHLSNPIYVYKIQDGSQYKKRQLLPWPSSVDEYFTLLHTCTPSSLGILRKKKKNKLDEHGEPKVKKGLSMRARRGAGGFYDVERDSEGHPILPIYIGNMTIYELGEILPEREDLHSEKYLWPIGFHSSKEYASLKEPLTDRWHYHSRILDGKDGPLFEVTAKEDPSFRFCEKSATSAWVRIVRAVQDKKRRLLLSHDGGEDDESRASVSGPEYFGYALPRIMRLLQELPGASQCRRYVMQDFGAEAMKREQDPSMYALSKAKKELRKHLLKGNTTTQRRLSIRKERANLRLQQQQLKRLQKAVEKEKNPKRRKLTEKKPSRISNRPKRKVIELPIVDIDEGELKRRKRFDSSSDEDDEGASQFVKMLEGTSTKEERLEKIRDYLRGKVDEDKPSSLVGHPDEEDDENPSV